MARDHGNVIGGHMETRKEGRKREGEMKEMRERG